MNTKLDSPLKKAPLFICGCPKSGTTLLRSLLDSHPELLVFPIETKFFRYTDYPTLFPEKKIGRESEVNAIVKTTLEHRNFKMFLRKVTLTFAGNEKPPDYSAVDPEKFEQYLTDLTQVDNLPTLFIHYFKALLVGMNRPMSDISQYHIVDKTPLQEEHAPILQQWFPNAKFIHIVRNPYATFVALRKRKESSKQPSSYPYLRNITQWISLSNYFCELNQRLIGSQNYMVLRYEDLIQKTESTMSRICSFANIPFEKSLIQPTHLGKLWSGNSMFQQRFSGIDRTPLERWKNEISDFEIALVNQKSNNIFETFEYSQIFPKSAVRCYFVQPHEGIKNYIYNRVFLQKNTKL